MIWRMLTCLALWAGPARACDLALLLALDVSGSVDPSEYRIQRDGLAAALRDPHVSEALVRGRAQVAVMQWTGASRQKVTLPWTQISDFAALETFADKVAKDARVWRNFSTAIGEALQVGQAAFEAVPNCRRKVIDVSGDGVSNEGVAPRELHGALRADGITVNALVIEGRDEDLTAWFWENVITGEGAFVVTANSFRDYPARIRQKLLREIVEQLATTDGGSPAEPRRVVANRWQ